MAKKKSATNKKKAPKISKKQNTKKVKSMKEKVTIKQPSRGDKASRIVGTIFIGLGVLLVAFGIYSFIQFRAEPTYDENLEIPTIEFVTELTNKGVIVIRGNAPSLDAVAIFANDQRVGEARVRDDSYEYEYEVEEEGEYIISVAGLKGFPFRSIGDRSAPQIAMVDMTPPDVENVALEYIAETNRDSFKLSGVVDPNTTVEIRRGVDSYEATSDEEGQFEIVDISLEEGPNVFTVQLSDEAGNRVTLEERVRVEYSTIAQVNGDGVTIGVADGTLPQASGDLDNLLARKLMVIFGLAAIFVFAGSFAYAYNKKS